VRCTLQGRPSAPLSCIAISTVLSAIYRLHAHSKGPTKACRCATTLFLSAEGTAINCEPTPRQSPYAFRQGHVLLVILRVIAYQAYHLTALGAWGHAADSQKPVARRFLVQRRWYRLHAYISGIESSVTPVVVAQRRLSRRKSTVGWTARVPTAPPRLRERSSHRRHSRAHPPRLVSSADLFRCRHAGYRYCGHVMAHAYNHIQPTQTCAPARHAHR
jgi:hypothetical protein